MTRRLKAVIIDGETGGRWHRWEETTPLLVLALEETGIFDVEVVTLSDSSVVAATDAPDFPSYDVVVLNYDAPDERWSPEAKQAFELYVGGGGGVVVYHGADNSFPDWQAYNEMIALGGWRDRDERAGHYCYLVGGKVVTDDASGPTGSHGRRLPFPVMARRPDHPVLRGLPTTWMHHADELYDRLRGPAVGLANMTVLASAFSPPGNQGTGRDEPMLMTVEWGEGRIFHTTLGHDAMSMSCVGFWTTLQRGCEWAATGDVTQPVPESFPTATHVLYRPDVVERDPVYGAGLNPIDAVR